MSAQHSLDRMSLHMPAAKKYAMGLGDEKALKFGLGTEKCTFGRARLSAHV